MASLQSKYMINDNESNSRKRKAGSVSFDALVRSTSVNLDPMLVANEIGIDKLPVLYSEEGKA